MKRAILIHNPTAGSGEHDEKRIVRNIESAGYDVKYYSTALPGWELFISYNADVIFVAGGDGTVQKVAAAMQKEHDKEVLQIPVQILPYGTANNIATTLRIDDAALVSKHAGHEVEFDLGEVKGIEEVSFFIEGMGCGIFPKLVQVMDAKEETEKQDEIKQAREELLNIIDSYEAQEAIIIADQDEITGEFLLVELLNIRFIGPNIELAPNAETGDGNFELIVVRENGREGLKNYVEDLLGGSSSLKKLQEFAETKKVSKLRLKWKGRDVHVDDEIIKNYRGGEINVVNRQGFFKFLRQK